MERVGCRWKRENKRRKTGHNEEGEKGAIYEYTQMLEIKDPYTKERVQKKRIQMLAI